MTYRGSWQDTHDKQKSTEKKQTYDHHHAAAAAPCDGLAFRTIELLRDLLLLHWCPLPPSRSTTRPTRPGYGSVSHKNGRE